MNNFLSSNESGRREKEKEKDKPEQSSLVAAKPSNQKKTASALLSLLLVSSLDSPFRFPPKISENSEENETFPFSLRILKKKKKKSFGERKREREKEKRRKRERARVSE